jgi:nucleotide-binding universal stress UspA family protein
VTGSVILVPLDGSQPALNALPIAKALAILEGAPIRILHVADRTPPLAELAAQLGVPPSELRGASIDVRPGQAAAVILEAAEEVARLVVLCTYSAPKPPAAILGETALAVLSNASCPVVLVNPGLKLGAWSLRRVLVPHEGTPATSDAVRPAAELAKRAGAELLVLQVAAPGAQAPVETGSITPPVYLDQAQHEWPAWTGEFIGRLGCFFPLEGLRVRLMLGHGAPADEILRVSQEQAADLIVMAWKGRWTPEHAETLKAVVRDAPCPTMVVRLQM